MPPPRGKTSAKNGRKQSVTEIHKEQITALSGKHKKEVVQLKKDIARLQQELAETKDSLTDANRTITERTTEVQKLTGKDTESVDTIKKLSHELAEVQREFKTYKTKQELAIRGLETDVLLCQETLKQESKKLAEAAEQIDRAHTNHKREIEALHFDMERRMEAKKMEKDLCDHEIASLSSSFRSTKLQLRTERIAAFNDRRFLIATITKLSLKKMILTFKMRSRLVKAHRIISDLLVGRMAENCWELTAADKLELMEAERRDKHLQLKAFVKNRTHPNDIMNSLESDLEALVEPVETLSQRVMDHKKTADGFSQQTVQLRGELNEQEALVLHLRQRLKSLLREKEDIVQYYQRFVPRDLGPELAKRTDSSNNNTNPQHPLRKRRLSQHIDHIPSMFKDAQSSTLSEVDQNQEANEQVAAKNELDSTSAAEEPPNRTTTHKPHKPKTTKFSSRNLNVSKEKVYHNQRTKVSVRNNWADGMMKQGMVNAEESPVKCHMYSQQPATQRGTNHRTNVAASFAANAILSPRYDRPRISNKSKRAKRPTGVLQGSDKTLQILQHYSARAETNDTVGIAPGSHGRTHSGSASAASAQG